MDGFATLGKVQSIGTLVICSLLSILFFGISYYLFTHINKNLKSGLATVVKAQCSQIKNTPTSLSNRCTLDISYVVDNKEYKGSIITEGGTFYTNGNTVPISYDSQNPSNVTAKQPSSIITGIIFLFVGIFCLFIGIYSYFLTSSSNDYAVASGINSIQSLFNQNRRYNQPLVNINI